MDRFTALDAQEFHHRHCDARDALDPDHECLGIVTITRKGCKLDCSKCGVARIPFGAVFVQEDEFSYHAAAEFEKEAEVHIHTSFTAYPLAGEGGQ